jgi:hypothetical protein
VQPAARLGLPHTAVSVSQVATRRPIALLLAISVSRRTVIRKKPRGSSAKGWVRHEVTMLERLRGVAGWRNWRRHGSTRAQSEHLTLCPAWVSAYADLGG